MLFTGCCSSWLAQPDLLYTQRPCAQGWHRSQWALPLHINHYLRREAFSPHCSSPISDDSSLCQVNKTLQHSTCAVTGSPRHSVGGDKGPPPEQAEPVILSPSGRTDSIYDGEQSRKTAVASVGLQTSAHKCSHKQAIIPALRRPRQRDQEFKVISGYTTSLRPVCAM